MQSLESASNMGSMDVSFFHPARVLHTLAQMWQRWVSIAVIITLIPW